MSWPKGQKRPIGFNKGINHPLFGKHHTEKSKRKMSISAKGRFGEDGPNWKGGYKKYKERLLKKRKRTRKQIKIQILKHYGNICKCCEETIFEFLTIDHIKGDGAKHNKEIKKGNSAITLYKWLIKNNFPDGFQILCFNCNITKGLYGKCPHNLYK